MVSSSEIAIKQTLEEVGYSVNGLATSVRETGVIAVDAPQHLKVCYQHLQEQSKTLTKLHTSSISPPLEQALVDASQAVSKTRKLVQERLSSSLKKTEGVVECSLMDPAVVSTDELRRRGVVETLGQIDQALQSISAELDVPRVQDSFVGGTEEPEEFGIPAETTEESVWLRVRDALPGLIMRPLRRICRIGMCWSLSVAMTCYSVTNMRYPFNSLVAWAGIFGLSLPCLAAMQLVGAVRFLGDYFSTLFSRGWVRQLDVQSSRPPMEAENVVNGIWGIVLPEKGRVTVEIVQDGERKHVQLTTMAEREDEWIVDWWSAFSDKLTYLASIIVPLSEE